MVIREIVEIYLLFSFVANAFLIYYFELYYKSTSTLILAFILSPITLLYNFCCALHDLSLEILEKDNRIHYFRSVDRGIAFDKDLLNTFFMLFYQNERIKAKEETPIGTYSFFKGIVEFWEMNGILVKVPSKRKHARVTYYTLAEGGNEKMNRLFLEQATTMGKPEEKEKEEA